MKDLETAASSAALLAVSLAVLAVGALVLIALAFDPSEIRFAAPHLAELAISAAALASAYRYSWAAFVACRVTWIAAVVAVPNLLWAYRYYGAY